MKLLIFLLLISSQLHAAEYIVQFKNDQLTKSEKSQLPLTTEYFSAMGNLYAKVVSEQKLNLKALDSVKYVETNHYYHAFDYAQSYDADPEFYKQWYLSNQGHNEPVRVDRMSPLQGKVGCDISAPSAWEVSKGSKDIVIAVVDTGVDYNHPELKDNIWTNLAELNGQEGVDDDGNGFIDDIHGYDFANNDGDPMDDNGHGTHCAGVIGASHNGDKIMGVLADVTIIPVKILDKKGYADTATSIKGVDYALKTPATVINCSWGGSDNSEILKELIAKAGERGVILVAAAGNSRGRNNDIDPTFPASYKLDNVISVGAHNAQAYFSNFSTRGPKSIHIAAPGTNIISTWPNGKYKVASGTSMASPITAAAIALAQYVHPELGPKELRQKMMDTGVEESGLRNRVIGAKRLDLYKLLQ